MKDLGYEGKNGGFEIWLNDLNTFLERFEICTSLAAWHTCIQFIVVHHYSQITRETQHNSTLQ